MTTDNEYIIELNDLEMKFKQVIALNIQSIKVQEKIVTGLVGPDASGKTTLLRILAGLINPSAGSIKMFGKNYLELGTDAHNIGYMPQRFGLYEELSVLDNLNLYAELRGLSKDERETTFKSLLEFASLKKFTARLAGRLSGGMKQKLGIACALLGSPRLLLLDEPSVGVDPLSRRELWLMVQELLGQGISVIWSTTYLDEAERCTDIIMLNQGKVLYAGSPKKMTERANNKVFQLKPKEGQSKELLLHWSKQEGVADALIQGKYLKVLAKEINSSVTLSLKEVGAKEIPPKLEDSYMLSLGGINQDESPFNQQQQDTLVNQQQQDTLVNQQQQDTLFNQQQQHSLVNAQQNLPVNQYQPQVISLNTQPVKNKSKLEYSICALNLTKKFGDFTAADNITFNVKQGQIFGLLGPNGAGKSTTFRMLCGLLKPTKGSCFVDNVNLLTSGSKARSRLGYMAQKFSLYTDIKVKDNIYIFGRLYGLSNDELHKRSEKLVNTLGLKPWLNNITGLLPLGQKQRLSLICATLHNPSVLFLDEPTSGVDVITRRDFWKHIIAMTQSGTSVLVTTHFMEEAEYCDTIALIHGGKMIALGSPDDLKAEATSFKGNINDNLSMEETFIAYMNKQN